MVKTHVKVFVRTRPTAANYPGLKVGPDGTSVVLYVPKDEAMGLVNNQQEDFNFKFDGVLENVSQESVYTSCTHEVVDGLLAGYNGTVFCYGQTGAGKTFTMSGDLHAYQHRGIIPRAVHHVFREMDLRTDKIYKVQVSYLEIYNEQLYDLLSDSPANSDSLAVLEDSNGITYVRGLTRVAVTSEEEALAQFFVGEQGRATAGHVLNASSSRSHALFTIHLETRTSDAASERAVLSKLHLVDLAGSERTKKSGVSGQTLKEAQFINRSLSFLEQTVNALARKDAYVPFRQSKLTSVLRDALGGNCRTVMLANIWGEPRHTEETLSTLRFAARVRLITSELSLTESSDPALLLKKYERQIKELKAELAMRDTLAGRGRITYDDPTDEELRELHATTRAFLQGDTDLEALPTDSLKRVRETYKMMRSVHSSMRSELAAQLEAHRRSSGNGLAQGAGEGDASSAGGVGDADRAGSVGFTLGQAPTDARPSQAATAVHSGNGVHGAGPSGAGSPAGAGGLSREASHHVAGGGVDCASTSFGALGLGSAAMGFTGDKNAVFRRYKHDTSEGKGLAAVLREHTAMLTALRARVKELSVQVNTSKQQIDELTSANALRQATAVTAADADVTDGEGAALASQLRAAKAAYRTAFDALREARDGLEPAAIGLAEARAALVDGFDRWMSEQSEQTLRRCAVMGGALPDDDEEDLDAGERFEKMQMDRIVARDPTSTAYHAAMRKSAPLTATRSAAQFAGAKAAASATRKMEADGLINAGLATKRQ